MKVILDTNVVISAVYFGGAPLKILKAWRDGQLELVVMDDILAEYDEIANRLHVRYPGVDFHPWIDFIRENATRKEVPKLYPSVCEDPDDDVFVACALASDAKVVCSGDRHLLVIDGHQGIEILAPRQFAEKYL